MLRRLQHHLEQIYELEVDYEVHDFLITDPELARALDRGADARETEEKLLLARDGEDLALSLYIDAVVLERLGEKADPATLAQASLSDLCVALEGVSHFLYAAWNSNRERAVTLFELELQAEVDKYVALSRLFFGAEPGGVPSRLRRQLFEHVRFDENLSGEQRSRYRDANRYAGKYCHALETRWRGRPGHPPMVNELRRFYRLPQGGKLRLIESAA